MTSAAGRRFRWVHRMVRIVAALCNWLRLVDLDVTDRSPLSVLGSGVMPEGLSWSSPGNLSRGGPSLLEAHSTA
jgi:hypothetical protein